MARFQSRCGALLCFHRAKTTLRADNSLSSPPVAAGDVHARSWGVGFMLRVS